MYQKILQQPLAFGEEIGSSARSILTGLLTRDPHHRLGVNGADDIKKHPFFAKHLDFNKLLRKEIQPPFKPSVTSPVDVSNFDTVFTAEQPLDSVVEGSHLSSTVQARFDGTFSFCLRMTGLVVNKMCRVLVQWFEYARQPRMKRISGLRLHIPSFKTPE